MIKLKNYQQRSLDVLTAYLESCRFGNINEAHDKAQYNHYGNSNFKPFQSLKGLKKTPYVCLRLPTGAGKTLLSAHTIGIVGNAFIENNFSLTLWLVPTNVIKSQTLETLKNPDRANYQVLANAYGSKFKVFDIADFRQIRPRDI